MITIIIPVYNRAKIVGKTLQSVVAQSYRPLNLILVDNNSSDDSLQVLRNFKSANEGPDFKISILTEKRQSAAFARDCGAKTATTDWLLFFDSDDIMHPDLVETYANKIRQCGANCDIIASRTIYRPLKGEEFEMPFYQEKPLTNHIFHSILATQRYIVRRDAIALAGGWNGEVRGWDDWELGIRLLLTTNRIAFIDDKPRVTVVETKSSITGQDFSSKHEEWEYALDLATESVANSSHPKKTKLLKYIDGRRAILAVLYARENNHKIARALIRKALKAQKGHFLTRLCFRIAFIWTALNLRGASHLIKRLQ